MSQFNILHFPPEILGKIFLYFDDTTISVAAGVCKRFNNVLNDTVRRKYNGSSRNKWYVIEIFDSSMENEHHEIVQHRPFILKGVSAIKLTFHAELNNQNHWMHKVIDRIGHNIQMICLATPKINAQMSLNFYNILSKTPNISHLCVEYVYPTNRKWCHQRYKKLTHLVMRLRSFQFDEKELKPFVKSNGQLKNVELELNDFRLLYAFDQTKIESLRCRFSHISGKDHPVHIQSIQMIDLKSMNLEVPKNSLNECIEKIVAPCQNLEVLSLSHWGDKDYVLTDESIDSLCSLKEMESIEPCFDMSLENLVRLIGALPKLVKVSLWREIFTLLDFGVLLKAANKHTSLRRVCFRHRIIDIFEQSLLNWLMENLNDRIQIENDIIYKLVINKQKVQYDGVIIMSANGTFEHEKITPKWLEGIQMSMGMNDKLYEFFSNLPILRALFDQDEVRDLHLSDEIDEALVKRKGKNITTASTTLSSNYDKSVNYIDWLEKYCPRLQELSIYIKDNHPHLPVWTFSELNVLRIKNQERGKTLDLNLFASLTCNKLNCLKVMGFYPFSVANIQVVRDTDLFDNLVTLQIFHFNEYMNNLLEQFNGNLQSNLRHLTLANHVVDGYWERYKINNKTITSISKFTNLVHLKLILAGINETNTKYLFENCTKLSELYFECNFVSTEVYGYRSNGISHLLAAIKSNCTSLKRLQLVWHDRMMDPYQVDGIKSTFPNVFIKIIQIDRQMITTAEKIILDTDDRLERLFDEIEV